MALLSFRGISTPSLTAQGEQRRSSIFNILRDTPREPAAPETPATKEPEVYTARAGDTFKSIAKRVYGATSKWRAIAELNPDLKSKKLRAGQLVKLPAAPTR
jgi:nucleoid-associated protein YgaU